MRATLVLVLSVLALGACGEDEADVAGNPYPDETRAEFTRQCVANGGTTASCECALKGIEKRLSFTAFRRAEQDIASGSKAPEAFTEAVEACTE